MPKWKRQNETVCMHGTVKCANAEDDADAQYIVTMHNADIDALTAERDELQRRLGAVIAEQNRWSDDACYCDFDKHGDRTLTCEYCDQVSRLRAIAEGRTE